VTLAIEIDRPGRVTLDIHDVAGRRVTRLVEQDLGAGVHEVVWDGRAAGSMTTPIVLVR